ncbi:hypothetical protein A0J61_11347 [Choanephora cucurbitarum]|uniref:Uncharacterized protein n=1 Tax=Choanephora cucurbitarum TaxID=101091 RepID=A0A1C7MZP0_9FUNG|nr:hypothetical protein A0J61_11347 [Choanephora cucurbitarum]
MTNEYEEIVHQVLVPLKALSYLKHSFENMREAYFDYRHQMPVAFFTDNVKGNQSFAEGIFESLKEGVEPADLERMNTLSTDSSTYLQLPSEINVLYLCRDFDTMEISLRSLLEEIKPPTEDGSDVAKGFDREWDICYSEGVDSCRVDVI